MLNEFNTHKKWLQSRPLFSDQSSTIELIQTYPEWLKEHFTSLKLTNTVLIRARLNFLPNLFL